MNFFDQKRLTNLKKDFRKICTDKINMISYEGFVIPYKKNNITNNFEIISQFDMLKNLNKFFKDLNLDYKYFIVVRNRIDLTKSLFVTLQERIEKLFGSECLDLQLFRIKIFKKG